MVLDDLASIFACITSFPFLNDPLSEFYSRFTDENPKLDFIHTDKTHQVMSSGY